MAVKKTESANRANHSNIAVENSAKAEVKPETLDDTTWDEARIQEAQMKLKEMYIQLRELRTTIPRLIEPLTTPQPSPTALRSAFSATVKTANIEVSQFRQLVMSDDSKQIFEYVKQSRAENPNSIKRWKITDYSDWLERVD